MAAQAPVRRATVGVIGHVNHGKTSLVKALSGIDTDRLEEEKRRGMSIVLGFAHLALPQGTLDLVDVPGHEQFVRTMVAGATGIEASLLVVDAHEGVKPQTVEHLAIADLLGLRVGVVALSKSDRVDPARHAETRRELRRLLRGTHLEFAPVVATSATTGEGLQQLREALGALLLRLPTAAARTGHAWLPIDRAFALAGHGTVATGTLRGGPLRVGDTLEALPGGASGIVRQLQVHHAPVEEALPGQRVGVNLRHLKPGALSRGDVLAPPGRLRPGVLLDGVLQLAAGVPASQIDRCRLRLLCGTTDVGATARVLGRTGERLLVQLRTTRPVPAVPGEPFLLRRESPAATLGGGVVLDAAPARHARSDGAAVERLRILAGGSAHDVLQQRLRSAGPAGLPLADLHALLGIRGALQEKAAVAPATPAKATTAATASATGRDVAGAADRTGTAGGPLQSVVQQLALVDGQRAWSLAVVEQLENRLLAMLRNYHAALPLRPGAPLALCRASLPEQVGDVLWRRLLERLEAAGSLVRRDSLAALPRHDPVQAMDPATRDALQALESAFREGGMAPPDLPRPGSDARLRALLDLLVTRGDILLLPGQPPTQRIGLHAEAVRQARGTLAAAFPAPQGFTVSQARELLGSTRKFTVPLLQHLHATGQTRRQGDLHAFVQQQAPTSGGE
ncbi:selenocysteine-specific translation elongation factor [Ramlibacter sp. AN1015]|uniref:selenocysteine-specific translation elongation factor n=1 Tax=Ramlibacter sp. AN1015 TaxID=3133428 RepID=UPI0030BDEBE7